jgi:hypothetical protein
LAIFLAVFCCCCLSAATKKKNSAASNKKVNVDEDGAKKRIKILEDKLKSTSMISLTDTNFTKFVVDRPRNYGALLMFTATEPKYQCSVCMKVKNNFEEVSKMYNAQYNFSDVKAEQKLVFFRLEVDSARNVFGELGLETVPRMYYLPPADVAAAKQSMEDLEIDSRPFMESISSALGHIEQFSKVQVCCLQKLFTKVHN